MSDTRAIQDFLVRKNVLALTEIKDRLYESANAAISGVKTGLVSTSMTFSLDAMSACGLKISSNEEIAKHVYERAFKDYISHPFKGFNISLLNTSLKSSILLPTKSMLDNKLNNYFPNAKFTKQLSGMGAGFITTMVMAPISFIKMCLMANILHEFKVKRLLSGLPATLVRDTFQFGIYYGIQSPLNEQFGSSPMTAGVANMLGYMISNPFNIIGACQKISPGSKTMLEMSNQIYNKNGMKGFYPLIGLALLSMFARGVALERGEKMFDSAIASAGKGMSLSLGKRE